MILLFLIDIIISTLFIIAIGIPLSIIYGIIYGIGYIINKIDK